VLVTRLSPHTWPPAFEVQVTPFALSLRLLSLSDKRIFHTPTQFSWLAPKACAVNALGELVTAPPLFLRVYVMLGPSDSRSYVRSFPLAETGLRLPPSWRNDKFSGSLPCLSHLHRRFFSCALLPNVSRFFVMPPAHSSIYPPPFSLF